MRYRIRARVDPASEKIQLYVDDWVTKYSPAVTDTSELNTLITEAETYATYLLAYLLPPFSTIDVEHWTLKEAVQLLKRYSHKQFRSNILTEAIVGFRTWHLNADGLLASATMMQYVWSPLKAFEARCSESPGAPCSDDCSCGIYIARQTSISDVYIRNERSIRGECYGWGRYVKAEVAWRVQYAYPKNFLITPDQQHLLPELMEYRVPIYVLEPVQIYDPREDGYENGQDGENRNSGTGADAGAGQGPETD